MDRGFYSEENINGLYREHVKFLVGTRLSLKFIKKNLDDVYEDDHLNYNINMYEENQNVQDTMLIGKDKIELSGYIGENISQIDQNIKFTIENEVDAGKFKQNDNVCFACHKDDSIREIDITGNGGYMLYGIKYNMDVDSVRTILSKSDIWTIQNDQTDTIFCKDKSNTYYFDIYLENGSVKSLSLHSVDSYCGYNHAE